jgi:hypothetical protein
MLEVEAHVTGSHSANASGGRQGLELRHECDGNRALNR